MTCISPLLQRIALQKAFLITLIVLIILAVISINAVFGADGIIASNAFINSTNLQKIKIDKKPNTIEGAPWGAISWDRAVEWLR